MTTDLARWHGDLWLDSILTAAVTSTDASAVTDDTKLATGDEGTTIVAAAASGLGRAAAAVQTQHRLSPLPPLPPLRSATRSMTLPPSSLHERRTVMQAAMSEKRAAVVSTFHCRWQHSESVSASSSASSATTTVAATAASCPCSQTTASTMPTPSTQSPSAKTTQLPRGLKQHHRADGFGAMAWRPLAGQHLDCRHHIH